MEIKETEWTEIKQGEYKRIKQIDPKNCNGYTARVLFKYYKKKELSLEEIYQIVIREEIKFLEEQLNRVRTLRFHIAGLQILEYPIRDRIDKLKRTYGIQTNI